MRRLYPLFLPFLLLPVITGCPGDSPTASKAYTDSVIVGTGRSGNSLTGEATAFTGGDMTIYWRVESADGFQAKNVVFEVGKLTDSGWSANPVYATVWEDADYYDHVHIGSYYHIHGAGTFRARAYLGSSRKLIGEALFTISSGTAG